MSREKQDVEKARFWRSTIREAARSGISVREFCRRRKLHECQFYWWQRRLSLTGRKRRSRRTAEASFALVSEEPGGIDAGIELVLAGRAQRGVVIGGTGAGACIAANKMPRIRAVLCHDTYSAHECVEHDDANVLCLGAWIVGSKLVEEILTAFLNGSSRKFRSA